MTPAQAADPMARRGEILGRLAGRLSFGCAGSKPYIGELSPGCEACGCGTWSCLFAGFRCDGDCFFCPGGQGAGEADSPTADGLTFACAGDYADFVHRTGVRAVSFSGGDPILELDAVLEHLRTLRRTAGDDLFIWLYTNGLSATAGRLQRLHDAGLDEIRFNIAATDYTVDAVDRAARIIDRVTVEIPAIPEDVRRVERALTDLARRGVDHVNLHQLMVIGGNAEAIRRRGYTVSDGSVPSVVESELAALELMLFVAESGLDLSIQYCGTAYKDRWLNRAQRVRINPFAMDELDRQTETGLIRRLWVEAPPVQLIGLASELARLDPDAVSWRGDAAGGRIRIDHTLIEPLASRGWDIRLEYLAARIATPDELPLVDSMSDAGKVRINERMTVGVALLPAASVFVLSPETAIGFAALCSGGNPGPGFDDITRLERIPVGLPDLLE